MTTIFDRQLDDRLDLIPSLTPDARTAVEAQRADLAAAQPPAEADAETAAAVEEAIDDSFVAGFRVAMLVAAAASLLSAGVAWRMVEGKTASLEPAVATF